MLHVHVQLHDDALACMVSGSSCGINLRRGSRPASQPGRTAVACAL